MQSTPARQIFLGACTARRAAGTAETAPHSSSEGPLIGGAVQTGAVRYASAHARMHACSPTSSLDWRRLLLSGVRRVLVSGVRVHPRAGTRRAHAARDAAQCGFSLEFATMRRAVALAYAIGWRKAVCSGCVLTVFLAAPCRRGLSQILGIVSLGSMRKAVQCTCPWRGSLTVLLLVSTLRKVCVWRTLVLLPAVNRHPFTASRLSKEGKVSLYQASLMRSYGYSVLLICLTELQWICDFVSYNS